MQNTPDSWQNLQCIDKSRDGESRGDHIKSKDANEGTFIYRIAWMHCANIECGQTLIRAERHYRLGEGQPANNIETWPVAPRHETRPVQPLVLNKEPSLARDFAEAVAVVPTSPRLSAVLARRIADDLLAKYAGRTEHFLGTKIAKFAEDARYDSTFRDYLQALNQLGIFGAHTKIDYATTKGEPPEIINVSEEQAKWTLDVVERLFDLFIVSAERDRKMIESIQEMALRARPEAAE